MHIIKDGQIVQDTWRHLDDGEAAVEGPVTRSLDRWRRDRALLADHPGPLGVRLNSNDRPEELADDLARLSLITLEFASLRDGRSFSQARLLRERYRYAGEIRARGDFMQDQMFFLSRVGVNAFEFADEDVASSALSALEAFSVVYQPSIGDPARSASAIGKPVVPRYRAAAAS